MVVSVVCTMSNRSIVLVKLFVLLGYFDFFFLFVDDARPNAKSLDVYCLCRRLHRHVVMVEKMRETSKHTEKRKEETDGEREKKKSRLFSNIIRQDEYYVHV